MQKDLVSIIIPVFNRPLLVADTIKSILLQTYHNWELILVDDGSTDNTVEVLEEFSGKDERIHFFLRDRLPKGPSICKNIGSEKARGDFLIFWDSDDIMAPWCVENRVAFLIKNPELDFAFFQILEFDENGGDLRLRCNVDGEGDDVEKYITYRHGGSTQTTIWRKDGFVKTGGWNEKNVGYEDIDLHLKAILKGLKYKWGSFVPDGFLRDDRRKDRLTMDGFSKQKGEKALALFKSISNQLDPEKAVRFKKHTMAKIWRRSFGLNAGDLKNLADESLDAGLFNEKEKREIIRFFSFYRILCKIPILRRPFYKIKEIKYKLVNEKFDVSFSSDIKKKIVENFSKVPQETKNKFFNLMPDFVKIKFFHD